MRPLFLILTRFVTAASGGIVSFTANPTVFCPGQDVTLSWSVVVQPSIATTYTLSGSTSGTALTDSVGGSTGTLVNATAGTNWARVNASGGTTAPDRLRLLGGASTSAPYIGLPNRILSGLTRLTFECWMTMQGAQSRPRYFEFGANSAGEQSAPGDTFSGTEYMTLTAQVGGTATSRRISMRDHNVENFVDIADSLAYGTEFHFACK